MNIHFKIIEFGTKAWTEAVNLRETVLRIPLGARFTSEELAEEEHHIHVAGYLDSKIVATAVLVPENSHKMKMQRVAVLESLRNKNIGALMMDFCHEIASKIGASEIYCHARNTAVNFYLKNGYSAIGAYFDEDGIPHLKMSKSLIEKNEVG